MKHLFTLFAALIFATSCMQNSNDQDIVYDLVGVEFYNEFIPCVGGEDFTQENVAEMMQGWRSLNISDDLLGAWGYVPATDQSRFENGWWELQWESKAQADAAWAAWNEDQEAIDFMEANESVMNCFGEERASWDFTFHRDVESFGPMPEDGSFFTEFFPCKFNNGKSSDDMIKVIDAYNKIEK